MVEYTEYEYTDQDTTLGQYFKRFDCVIKNWTIAEFLLYSENMKFIWFAYLPTSFDDLVRSDRWMTKMQNLNENDPNSEFEDFPLISGVKFHILNTKINRYNAITENENQIVIDPSDKDPFMVDALEKLINNPLYVSFTKEWLVGNNTVTQFSPKIRVWLWSRTLSLESGEDVIINLTPFVTNVSTNVNQTGNFSIGLVPMPGTFNSEGWKIDHKMVEFYKDQFNRVAFTGRINTDFREKNQDGNRTIIRTYFDKVTQKNDVIFISYEKLDLEKERGNDKEEYLINKMDLAGNVFDMIGVVKGVPTSLITQGNNLTVSLTGQDLTSIMNDDTFYIFPEMYLTQGLFYKGLDDKGLVRSENKLLGYVTYNYKNLSTYVSFIMNALTTVSITSDNLFSSYGSIEENGVTINKKSTYFKLPTGLESDQSEFGAGQEAKGIWQIVKVIIDEQIKDRYIVDSSLGNVTSTALANMTKVVQEPFVQMLADTYDNQFYLTFRQAPWDRNSYKKLATIADDKFIIRDEDVLSMNFNYNNDEVFSWYRLTPRGLMEGQSDGYSLAYLKAIRFPEYANIWGESACEIESSFIRMYLGEDGQLTNRNAPNYEQALLDLKFLVDSYKYMPFTRKGSIVIKGDRRYKRGLVVYNEVTDEYFYVDGVQQNFTTGSSGEDRTTTLTLSRGLVKRDFEMYFNLIDTKIDTSIFKNKAKDSEGKIISSDIKVQSILKNWKVNPWVFDYFLKRRQFAINPNVGNSIEAEKAKIGKFGEVELDDSQQAITLEELKKLTFKSK